MKVNGISFITVGKQSVHAIAPFLECSRQRSVQQTEELFAQMDTLLDMAEAWNPLSAKRYGSRSVYALYVLHYLKSGYFPEEDSFQAEAYEMLFEDGTDHPHLLDDSVRQTVLAQIASLRDREKYSLSEEQCSRLNALCAENPNKDPKSFYFLAALEQLGFAPLSQIPALPEGAVHPSLHPDFYYLNAQSSKLPEGSRMELKCFSSDKEPLHLTIDRKEYALEVGERWYWLALDGKLVEPMCSSSMVHKKMEAIEEANKPKISPRDVCCLDVRGSDWILITDQGKLMTSQSLFNPNDRLLSFLMLYKTLCQCALTEDGYYVLTNTGEVWSSNSQKAPILKNVLSLRSVIINWQAAYRREEI